MKTKQNKWHVKEGIVLYLFGRIMENHIIVLSLKH